MRIRKNASRLLGSASDPLHPPPPPPPPAISAAAEDCSNACSSSSSCSSVCELNRSPWDLIDSKEEEHDRGIMGSSVDQEDNKEEEPIADAASIADTEAAVLSISAESEAKIKEKKEVKIKCCSKRGKGWNCIRPAEPSHNFCGYHLAKLRSSTVGRKRSAAAVSSSRSNAKKRALRKSPSAASSDSSSYYYYSRFVPWQAKRRGGADIKVKEDISMVDEASGLNSGEDETENAEGSDERGEETVALCNKKDGKGWECKKPAELPHSYCSHHLAKIRSRNTDSGRKDVEKKETAIVTQSKINKKMAGAASESNFYYYYGGFGPWRSKMRGKPAEDHESKAKDRIQDEEIVKESSDFDDGDEEGEEKLRELKDIESDQK